MTPEELNRMLGYAEDGTTLERALQAKADAATKQWQDMDTLLGYGGAPDGGGLTERQQLARREIADGRKDPKSGLVWGPSGGWDPSTYELVVAGKPFQQLGWSAAQNTAEAASLGLGSRASAALAATGGPEGMSFGDKYGQALTQIKGGKEAWARDNTGASVVTELGGSAIPLVLLGGGLGGAAGGALSRLPGGAAATRFLSGNAGSYSQGIIPAGTRLASDVASGALAGAAGGAATAGLHEGSLAEQTAQGAAAGGALGPFLNPLARAWSHSDVVVPKGNAEAAQKLLDAGVPIRAAHMLGKSNVNGEAILDAATQQVAKSFGADKVMAQMGTRGFTPEVVERAERAIGQKFEDFAASYGVPLDTQARQDLVAATRDVISAPHLTEQQQFQLKNMAKHVMSTLNKATAGGVAIDGKTFRGLTASNSAFGKALRNKDPEIAGYARQVRDALYDLVDRTAPPEAAELLSTARNQWANYKAVERVVDHASTTGGMVDPTKLAGIIGRPGLAPELRDLAQGARMLPRPTAQGTPGNAGWLPRAYEGAKALGGGGLGGFLATAGITEPTALGSLAAMTGYATHGPNALIGAGVGAAGNMIAREVAARRLASEALTRDLIRRSMDPRAAEALGVNPLISAGVAPAYNYRSGQ